VDTFDELIDGGVALLEGMGKPVQYTPRGTDAPFDVLGILDESAVSEDPNGSYGEELVSSLTTLHVADRAEFIGLDGVVYKGVAKPKQGDRVTYKGATWEVRNYLPDGMGLNVIELVEPRGM